MRVLIFDCDKLRGEKLRDAMLRYHTEVYHYPQVWDLSQLNYDPMTTSMGKIRPYLYQVKKTDIIFIHHNDDQQYFFWNFIQENCFENLVIMYSGGGLPELSQQKAYQKPNFWVVSRPLGSLEDVSWNIEGFFEAVINGHKNPLEVLKTPNYSFELELLQECLTSKGAKKVLRDREMINTLKQGNRTETFNEIKGKIHVLSEIGDCFSPEYISTLSFVRSRLLPS